MNQAKALIVLGTRPEAIKLAPVILELQRTKDFELRVCVTGQHRQMLDPMLSLFSIRADYDLDIMRPDQTLPVLTARLVEGVGEVVKREEPTVVLVQGDTTTAMAGALAGFYARVKVGHVEAGLRTGNKWAPFPEEMNRRLITQLADLHFAPTQRAVDNLLQESIPAHRIFLTGNTVVDALMFILERGKGHDVFSDLRLDPGRKIVLVTVHRRESFGAAMENICSAIRCIATSRPDVQIVFPVHLNPSVRKVVFRELSSVRQVLLIDPLDYLSFVRLMASADIIMTDSGGIQEEAPSFGVPVVVLREVTERPEAVEAGLAKLVGTDPDRIAIEVIRLVDSAERAKNSGGHPVPRANPFGDGKAARRVVEILLQELVIRQGARD